jgi:hypothetical protein
VVLIWNPVLIRLWNKIYNVTITIDSITSDEPTISDRGSGSKKHAPDADGVGTDTALLSVQEKVMAGYM